MRRKLLLFLSVLCLLCTAKADVRYALNPEGFESGAIPSGWTQESVEGTGNWLVEGGEGVTLSSPTGAKSGNWRAAVRCANGSTDHSVTRLITPAVDLTGYSTPQLHFAYAQAAVYTYFDTLCVYYRTSATAAWTLLQTYDKAAETWQTAVLDLPGYLQGSAYQIAFEASDHAGKGVVLDDISIRQPSLCAAPQIILIQPASSTAYIEYAAGGTGYDSPGDYFDIVVSDSALADPAAATADEVVYLQKATTETSLTLTGLTTYTDYYVYLRTNCSDNESGYTDWVSGTFKTTMLKSLPFSEKFNYSRTTSDYYSPAGWTFANNFSATNVPYVFVGSSSSYKQFYSVDSTSYLAFSKSATQATVIDSGLYAYAATPELDGNLQECEVSFWGTACKYVYNGVVDYASELTVGVMTDPTDFTTFTAIKTVQVETAYQFKHFTVSLSGYTGTGRYVALVSDAKSPNLFFVDNLEVKQATVAVPEDVRAYNALPTGFDIAANILGADTWNVKVSTKYVRDASTLEAADCLLNLTGLTGATYHVNSTDIAGKTVVIYVQAVKNGVASDWAFPVTLRVPTVGVLPIELTMNTGAYQGIKVYTLNNEIHYKTTTDALGSVYFAPRGCDGYSNTYFYPVVSSSAPIYEGGHLDLNGIDNYVAFPYIEDIDTLVLSFRLSVGTASTTYAGQSRVAVGVMTDPYDLTTFEELGQFEGGAGTYEKCEQYLLDYKGTGHYVAIRALKPASSSSYGSYNALDNIVLKTVPSCRQATNVEATASVDDATISWTANGMSKWLVSLYSNSTYTTLLRDTAVTTNSVVLGGLTANTTYYYTVRTMCGTDTLKIEDEDQKYAFTTALGVPFLEKFTSNSIPDGWTKDSCLLSRAFAGATPVVYSNSWYFTNSLGSYTGTADGYYACINNYSTSKKDWLITPDITIKVAADASVQLTFDVALTPYKNSIADRDKGVDDQFAVLISTDGGNTWTRSNATVWNNLGDGSADYVYNDLPEKLQTVSIDMTKYIGQTVRVAFYAESTVSNADNYILVDNVKIATYDANCAGIKTLSATATGESTATVVWTVGGEQSAHIDVIADGEKTAFFSGDVTTSPYQLSGLSSNTSYTVYAYQSCNAAGDTLTSSFRTDCGKSSVDDLGTITFNDQNSLACWTVGIGDTTGVGKTTLTAPSRTSVSKFGDVLYMNKPKKTSSYYYGNNYYAIMPPLDIDSIAKYQVVFDAATTTAASDTVNVKKLYVGVITDPTDLSTIEITDTLTLQYAADSTGMKTYAIGFDNYAGDYLGEFGTNVIFMVSAPEAYNDIALIDNVRLEPVSGCHQVIDLTASDVKVNAVSLKWSSEADNFRLVVTDKLCDPDTVSQFVFDQVVNGKTVTVNDLSASTNYYAYIKAICGVGDSARWSGNTAFRTAYGVPFLEPFAANSLTDGIWNGYKTTFGKADILDITGVSTSTSTTAWYMTKVPSGVVGQKDYAARVEVYGTGSYDALLVSPQISLPEASESEDPLAVSFVVAKTKYSSSSASKVDDSSDDKFSVFVSEDGKKWARSASTVWASDGSGDYDYNEIPLTGKKYRVDLSAYKGKAIYLGFFTESTLSAPDTYLYVDSVKVDYYQPTCDGITSFTVLTDKVTANTAALKVKSANASDTIEYVLGVDSVNWATAVAHHADSTLVYLNGLTPSTTYCVYARSLCATGDTSAWAGPITFTTGCMETIPVSYNFDDKNSRYIVESGASEDFSVENCWNIRYSYYYYAPTLKDNSSYYTYSYSGTSAWAFYKSSGYYMLLAMPEVDADLDGLQLSFMARAGYEYNGTLSNCSSSYAHSVEVGTMDNLGDTTTFHLIKEVVLDPVEYGTAVSEDADGFWRQQIISLEGATGKYIVFLQRESSLSNYIYIDDVNLSKRLDCEMVEKVTVDSIRTTSALAHWTSEGDNFYVTLVSDKDTTSFATTDTVCTLTGLTAHTVYTLEVASVCGTDTTMAVKKNFTTLYTLPLIEDFTNGMPSDWSALDGDVLAGEKAEKPEYSSYCWTYTGSDSYGINAPKVRWNLGSTSSYERNSLLITPQVELNAAATNQVLLSFDMALTGSYSSSSPSASYMKDRKFAILVSEDDGTTWSKIDSLVWGTDTTYARRFDSIPATSTHYTFDFSAYKDKTIRLAFYAYAPATYGYSYLHLTNIALKEFNPNCLAPENLTATNVSLKGATLAWESTAAKFELQVATDKACTNVVLDSVVTDTTLVVKTLNSGALYYARVRSLCGTNEYSDWSSVCTFTTSYGLPFVEEFTSVASYIPNDWTQYKSLPLATLLNTTDPFTLATSSTNWSCTSTTYNKYAMSDANHVGIEVYHSSAYKDSWLLTPVIDLTENDKDYIIFSFDAALTYWSSTAAATTENQQFYVAVSEDAGQTWNKANVITWSDAATDSATYTMASIPNGAGKTYKFDFSQYAGKSIQIAFGVTATANDNRLHIDNVYLVGADNVCFGPKEVSVTATTATTATVEITPAASDSVWQYAYLPSGSTLTDETERIDLKTTKFTLTNLNAFTAYDVYIRSICGGGDTSEWISTSLITAMVPPMAEEFSNISTTESLSKGWEQYKAVSLETLLGTTNPFGTAAASTDWGYSSYYNENALTDEEHVSIQWYYSYTNNWMLSPVIDLTNADADKFLKFSFDAAATINSSDLSPSSTENHKFYVAVSEDAGMTWTKANLISWSDVAADSADYTTASIPNGLGHNYKFDFSQYSGKVIRVAFGVYAASTNFVSNRLHLDNIRLEEVENACFGVKGLTATDATSTTATLEITPAESDKRWQYAYVRSDSTLQNTTKHFDTDTTVFTVAGLKPNTEYSVYVRSICGVGDTSEWASTTVLTAYAVPFAEDFDDVASEYPTGWTRYSSITPSQLFSTTDPFASASEITSTSSYWGYSTSYNANAFNDDPHISISVSISGYNYWAVTPKIELVVADTLNAVLTFDAALTSSYGSTAVTSADQYFYVAVSADGGHTWKESDATIWSDNLSEADHKLTSIPNGTGANYTINLTQYAGKTVQVAFGFGLSSSSSSARLHLDNIHINASKECFDVENVELAASTTSSLSLQVANTNKLATEWQYVSGKNGFNRADSLVHSIATPDFTLTGLQTGTLYDVYVRSICSGTDTSAWVGPFTFSTSYGIPFSEPFDDMSTVLFPANWKRYNSIAAADLFAGTKSFATATEYTTESASSYYWSYSAYTSLALNDENHISAYMASYYTGSWAVTPVIDLSAAEEDEMLLFSFDAALSQFSTSNAPSSTDNQKFYVLVSEDAGNTWSRENAILWSNAAADSADYVLSAIPNTAGQEYVLNFTKYAGKNIQIAFGVEATSNYTRLHIDNVNLYAASGFCFAPANVTRTESTVSSLKLTITDTNNESGWQYAYGEEGFTLSGTAAHPANGNEIELTGLTASTYYDVYVRTVCGVGDTSAWVGPFTFSTSYGVPFSEPFDGVTSYAPENWTQYKSVPLATLLSTTDPFASATASTQWSCPSSYNSNALSDANHIGVEVYYASSFQNSWLLTPVIDLTENDKDYIIFSFDVALTYWNSTSAATTNGQQFYVAVSEDAGHTWTKANVITWSDAAADSADYTMASIPNGAGDNYKFDFSQYTGKSIQIAFGVNATANDSRLHIDNVNLYATNSLCFGVNGIQQKTATGTTATVSFTEISTAAKWQYAYGAAGFMLTDQTAVHRIDSTAFTITGLQQDTYYDVYVRSICSEGDTSAWAGPCVVKTALGVPYKETFDDIATVSYPADWKRYRSITPADLFAGTKSFVPDNESTTGWNNSYGSNAFADENHIGVEIYSTYSGSWTVTPVIDLSTGIEADKTTVLTFDAALTKWSSSAEPGSTATQSFYVVISEDGGQTWSKSNATVWGESLASADYLLSSIPNGMGATYEINLSKYVGKCIQVALGVTASSNDNRLHIDNFSIHQIDTVAYTASVCNSADYQDDHFSIARTDLKVGETTYTNTVAGQGSAPDTAYVLTLTVYPAVQVALYDTICQGYTYDQYGFNFVAKSTAVVPMVFTSVNGCDSLVELHLEVIPTQYVDTTIRACQSYTYKGVTYYSDKIFTDTLASSLGCDSIVRTFLRISSTGDSETEWRTSICSGDTYDDEVFAGLTKAGVYTQTVQTAFGCDSTVTLYLLVADESNAIYDTIQQADLPYVFEGEIFLGVNTKVGDYTHDIQSSCGQVTLNMHVTTGTGIDNTSVHTLQLTPNPARIGEPVQIVTDLHNASEYALSVISSTGQLVYESHTPALTLPGLPIAGIYTVRLVADGKVYQARLLVK